MGLLAACQPPSERPAAPGGADGSDTGEAADPWADFQVDRPEAEAAWTAAEIEALLQTWGDEVGLPRPAGLFAEYRSALLEGDEDCPGEDDDLTDDLSGCTSETGWNYSGICILSAYETRDEDEVLTQGILTFDIADFVITRPDGLRFVVGGRAHHDWQLFDDGGTTTIALITGSWSHQWTELPWLAQTLSADLEYVRQTGSQQALRIFGSMTTGDTSLVWDEVDLDARDCPGLPKGGELWLRQPDASWNHLAFRDDCSGCAEVTWNNSEVLGEVCLDLTHIRTELASSLDRAP